MAMMKADDYERAMWSLGVAKQNIGSAPFSLVASQIAQSTSNDGLEAPFAVVNTAGLLGITKLFALLPQLLIGSNS